MRGQEAASLSTALFKLASRLQQVLSASKEAGSLNGGLATSFCRRQLHLSLELDGIWASLWPVTLEDCYCLMAC